MSMADTNKNGWILQELFFLLGYFVQSNLMRQIDYLKVENKIMRSKLGRCVYCTPEEKRRLLKFGKLLGPNIKGFASIVCYSTFRKWIREEGSVKSKVVKKRGRNRKPEEIRELIVKLAKENNWGYTRILGELKKLGITNVSRTTVKNILVENGIDPAPKRGEDSWDEFIKRHFKTLHACDFFTKTVWTLTGPKMFFVLFFINVHTRKVHIAGVTRHPNGEWLKDKVKLSPYKMKLRTFVIPCHEGNSDPISCPTQMAKNRLNRRPPPKPLPPTHAPLPTIRQVNLNIRNIFLCATYPLSQ